MEVQRPTLRLRAEHYVNVLLAPDMKLFGNYLYKTSNIYLEYLHSDKALTTYLVTMHPAPSTPNVVFITESEDVSSTCLVGKTMSNDHSRQLAFTPDLFVSLLDLVWLTVLIHFQMLFC